MICFMILCIFMPFKKFKVHPLNVNTTVLFWIRHYDISVHERLDVKRLVNSYVLSLSLLMLF